MYEINNINIGEKIKHYRKLANITLSEVGKRINKSKATIFKYENNQIIPDAITLLELCNCLNISIDDIVPSIEKQSLDSNSSFNPFETNRIFMYYYTNKKLINSIIDIYSYNNCYNCKLYNGIKNSSNYQNCAYFYNGIFESNGTIAYFTLDNSPHNHHILEKVQIVVSLPLSSNTKIYKGLLLGLTPNSLPIVKKVLISSFELTNITKYSDALTFSKKDLNKIYDDGALIIENKNYNEFFFDS